MSEPRPKVSVVMITYNHEEFIEQAVNSVLMQGTDFDYEIIIGEDCSTDRTREILIELQKRHPDKIKLVLNPQNLGMIPNFVNVLSMARGEYVALLEGDDYWIDKYKLAKQVQFLEDNPEYVLVGTNAVGFRQDTGQVTGLLSNTLTPFDFDTRQLMLHNPCPTLTVVFRNGLIKHFPPIYFTGSGGDRRLYILLSQHGKCHRLVDATGVYRIHPDSATGKRRSSYEGRKGMLLESILNAERWNEYLGGGYQHEVELVREKASRSLVLMALRHLDVRTALEFCAAIDQSKLRGRKSRMAVRCLKVMRRAAIALGWKAATTEELIKSRL